MSVAAYNTAAGWVFFSFIVRKGGERTKLTLAALVGFAQQVASCFPLDLCVTCPPRLNM